MTSQPQQLDYARLDPKAALARQFARANTIAMTTGILNAIPAALMGLWLLMHGPAWVWKYSYGDLGVIAVAILIVVIEASLGLATGILAIFARRATRRRIICLICACAANYGLAITFLVWLYVLRP